MIYDKVMQILDTADVKGSVIRKAIDVALNEVEKEMFLYNQSFASSPKMMLVISQEDWDKIREEFRK